MISSVIFVTREQNEEEMGNNIRITGRNLSTDFFVNVHSGRWIFCPEFAYVIYSWRNI